MLYLEQNIRGLCDKFGLDYLELLADLEVDNVSELSVSDLEAISEEYETTVYALLFEHSYKTDELKAKLNKIKLLVIDVDGVMTDGGMYFSESGDQIKKFNTKDGMAILHLTKSDFQVAIISSGFRGEAVKKRAEMLGIQYCYVGRDPKMGKLEAHCKDLNIDMDAVAMIGDDINDLPIMKRVGLSACPSNAVMSVKRESDIVLDKKGGEACVREFIDQYLLEKPLD